MMSRRWDAKSQCFGPALAFLGALACGATAYGQPAQPPTQNQQPAANREQELHDRVDQLERRIDDLESTTVLSEPETRVRQIEVYVDENGVEYDEPLPGTRRVDYLPTRAGLPAPDDQREDRRSARRCGEPQRRRGRGRRDHSPKRPANGRNRHRGRRQHVRARVRGSVLHCRPRAEHRLLCRHRRLERHAARQRSRRSHAVERLCRAAREPKRAEPARSLGDDRAREATSSGSPPADSISRTTSITTPSPTTRRRSS